VKLKVRRGLRHWYWSCFDCSEGFAERDWRAVFDSAVAHAAKPEHQASQKRAVKVRRNPAWRNWHWNCSACDTGGAAARSVDWSVVLDAANRHARQGWHREKVRRGRS